MKVEISLPEVVNLFKEIQEHPESFFEMIRVDVRESVDQCLTKMMDLELTQFFGRGVYKRVIGDVNHHNGCYGRRFTLKGIGEVPVKVPKDRNGEFNKFKEKWQQDLPSTVKCLENSIEACFNFFICPEKELISSRTSNIIERLNKEFKRRTKPSDMLK